MYIDIENVKYTCVSHCSGVLMCGARKSRVFRSEYPNGMGNNDITLLVDFRENRGVAPLIGLLERYAANDKIQWKRANLPVGDLQFVDTNDHERVFWIVERKSMNDFLNSINTGHLAEQRRRLAETGSKVAILYESTEPNETILQSCLKMHLIEGFHVVHCFDTMNTYWWIRNMFRYLSMGEALRHSGNRFSSQQARKSQYELEFQQRVFASVHGITPEVADELVRRYGTVVGFVLSYFEAESHDTFVKEVADIQVPGRKRRIGVAVANELLRMLQIQRTDAASSSHQAKPAKKRRITSEEKE